MPSNSFGTVDHYRRAIADVLKEGISDKQRALMERHLAAPRHTVSWEELAADVGYSSGKVVNLKYGELAHRIAEGLGLTEAPEGFWLFVLVNWAKDRSALGHTRFKLRPEVVEALEQLGILRSEQPI
jgi:hypothetical protein